MFDKELMDRVQVLIDSFGFETVAKAVNSFKPRKDAERHRIHTERMARAIIMWKQNKTKAEIGRTLGVTGSQVNSYLSNYYRWERHETMTGKTYQVLTEVRKEMTRHE